MNNHEEVAKVVQNACLEAVKASFDNARMDGLCCDGALEVALDAIRSLKIDQLIQDTFHSNTKEA